MSETALVKAEDIVADKDGLPSEAKPQAWRDDQGREIFVSDSDGIDKVFGPWGAVGTTTSDGESYLVRHPNPVLQWFPTRAAAQRNLDLYALQKGWAKVRTCRECGCTDRRACAGGCAWVEEDLCSSCLPAAHYDRCPFCHAGEWEVDQVGDEAYAVVCEVCGAQGPMALRAEDAVRCWRSRRRT